MIDYGKFGPANTPTPTTPSTTTPVAPANPGSLAGLAAPSSGALGAATGPDKTGFTGTTQAQVDAMNPLEKLGRGFSGVMSGSAFDTLGQNLFGQGNGSALGGVPFLGDAVGGLGNIAHGIGAVGLKPFEAGAAGLARIPLGWVPGGADDTFNKIGEKLKAENPSLYQDWLIVQHNSNNDFLAGGNQKADFNIEYLKMLDDSHHDSALGSTPDLAIGSAGIGSYGGGLSAIIKSFMGIASNTVQGALGKTGALDPGGFGGLGDSYIANARAAFKEGKPIGQDEVRYAFEQEQAGKFTTQQADDYIKANAGAGRDRVDETVSRFDRGGEVSDVEKQAVEAYKSGAWSKQHAADFIVSHGQGFTRNPVGQIVGSVLTDPLTYATIGAGAISKAGLTTGARIAELAGEGASFAQKADLAVSNMEKLAVLANTMQSGRETGYIFRAMRGAIDPLAVYKPSSVMRAVSDMKFGVATEALQRSAGPMTIKDIRALAREFKIGPEIDSAMGTYALDKFDEMATIKYGKDMLNEGFGEELVHTHPDEAVDALRQFAPRDASTELTDHMQRIMKNTFTAEEDVNLAGRMATVFGNDASYWKTRLATMSFDMRSTLHAVTYKRAEVGLEKARALIDHAAYDGPLPIKDLVLVSPDTLDNVTAEAVIANIKATLKNADKSQESPIEAATKLWNDASKRYPTLANIGIAPGGQEQLETLVKTLEKELDRGGITKVALPEELAHPALRPMRDFLDRNSVQGAELTTEQVAARGTQRAVDALHVVKQAGFEESTVERFFANLTKSQKVVKSNGRTVGETVYRYPKSAYKDMRLFLSADGKTGFAIKADGDLVSVFNTGEKGLIQKVIPSLHDLGATKLDAFDEAGRLPELYGKGGFVETGRDAWDPQYAPKNWTGGTPDVVYMAHPGVAEATHEAQPLWKIGFRPKEEVAWGLKRDANTGRYTIDRAPTISHNVDAVPFGRQRFSDTTRNVLGQIIGTSKAESVTKPVESIEAYVNTLRDGITGQRLVNNIERRFERSTFDAGIPKPLSAEIMKKAKEAAGLEHTTLRGLSGSETSSLWKSVADNIPIDFALKDGTKLNVHIIMDHLLQAAEGDFRIMGVTSKLSQTARNAIRKGVGPVADPNNMVGQLTVGAYNAMRYYFNPMFVIQRITDAPYYSVLYGVIPVGRSKLTEANQALHAITENMGRTGLARHFSMDMPEYATRSNFTEGIRSGLQQAGLLGHRFTGIVNAPDGLIASNMTNMLHARMGDIVKGALDNLATAAERADPAMKAEMLAAGEKFQTSFQAIAKHYHEMAGRILDDNEVGMQYVQDMLSGWRHSRVNPDGTLDFTGMLRDGEWTVPNGIGEIGSIHPDDLAQEIGAHYADGAALRKDVMGHWENIKGVPTLVKGEHDIKWLEEQMRTKLHLHPDVIKRGIAYFGDTWDGYWNGLARSVEEGGLDISPHYAKEAQDLIAMEAKSRGMDPWEYLSGVMSSNIGGKDLNTHMGKLFEFLKAGKSSQPLEEWTKVWRSHLDVSGQDTLMQEFEAATGHASPRVEPAQFEFTVPKSAPGAAARPAVAKLPSSFKAEPGYAYRVEKPGTAAGGIPDHVGLTTGKPTSFYNRNEGEAIFRVKEADVPGQIGAGRHIGGDDRLTVGHIPPEKTEMLGADGVWHPLEADPYDNFFGNEFPQMVKDRIASGKPHPNPEVEGYMQHLSKWVNDNIGGELGSQTRSDLRDLVEKVPTTNATPFNRTHALVVTLLKNKIQDAQQDIFRLAEMQTKRSVLERSLNHPLFGLYPSSYMWGKVLPETVKFLAKNPYAATYIINDVQRAIATQREYDTDFDSKMHAVDKSAGAFLADYLTPSLPWSDHSARFSPLVRDILGGKDIGAMFKDELATISPQRWVAQVINAANEIPGAVKALQTPSTPQDPALQSLSHLAAPTAGATTPAPTGSVIEGISGPTPAAGLAPILADDLARLRELFVTKK